MSARDQLRAMVPIEQGSRTVWSPDEVGAALDAHRAEVLAEAKTETVAWLVKKAREGAPVGELASKLDRGAVRIFIGTGHFRDAMDAHHDKVTRGNADWLEGIGQHHAAEMLRHSLDMDAEIAAAEEKVSTTVPTATPDDASTPPYADVPAGEISITGYPPITLSGWTYTELAPDYYGHVYMQIGGWLPEGRPSEDTPVGTQQMAYAHLHGHAMPRDLNVQMESKAYGGARRFLKIQWRKPGEPESAPLTARQERLLAHMRAASRRLWSTGPVEELYRAWHIRTPRHEARRDLARLDELGHLTRHGDDTGRRYRLNTRKDGD
ncbi:hypothetical protein [Streptomyces niveus]|uniref:hypothetical protein n=1 Tax=Streptomyces niveus TaxID=193462 RepID=UPI00084CBA7F|nr:hypothetical protein [Streptomyces niveus]